MDSLDNVTLWKLYHFVFPETQTRQKKARGGVLSGAVWSWERAFLHSVCVVMLTGARDSLVGAAAGAVSTTREQSSRVVWASCGTDWQLRECPLT